MRSIRHIVVWHGERYVVEPLPDHSPVTPVQQYWAVTRRGEFIGAIPSGPQESEEEFEHRCARWVADLIGL